jgi:hypothetical protein
MYSTMINGYTRIDITKHDVLTGIPEIKVAVAYDTPCLLLHHVSVSLTLKIGGAPIASMPASLAVLASVEVDYVTLPGWTEPLAACKACAFVSLLMPLPVFFSLGAPDVRGTPQERSGLREVVNFAANGCHTLHARCSSCLNILTSISSFAHRNLHHQSPSSVSRSFTPRLPRATATALLQVCSPTMPRLILRALAVFMLPDAHSWRGLLPPLSCLPCTAAVDAFPARRPVRDIACSRPSLPQKNMQQASGRAACVVSGGFHAAS